LRRWTTQGLVRFVYGGQQFDVGSRVALGEAACEVAFYEVSISYSNSLLLAWND
jgi:hypothetical protein